MLYWKEEAERVFWHCLPPLRGCVHNAGTLRRQPENPLVSSLCYCRETSGDPLGPFGWLRGQLEESATCCSFTCKDSSEFPSRDRRRRFARQLGPPPVSLRIRLPSTLPSCGLRTRAVFFPLCEQTGKTALMILNLAAQSNPANMVDTMYAPGGTAEKIGIVRRGGNRRLCDLIYCFIHPGWRI